MKYLSLLFIVLVATACYVPNPRNYHVPAGYKTCHTNYECNTKDGEFCGFMGVDTYPVCRH
jgi:hypothetical protein